MDMERTFDLEELDDVFWEKAVFVEIWNSSGLGGPGCIWVVTDEKRIYNIGFDGFPYEYNLGRLHPLLRTERCDDEKGRYVRYAAEQSGWKYSRNGKALIREELFDAFEAVWKEIYDKNAYKIHYVFGAEVIGIVLGAASDMERWDYIVSARKRREEEELYRKLEEERERKKLTGEDFVWKPHYINNQYSELSQTGYYCLLLKENEGRISGVRFTIEYQVEETSPLCSKGFDAPIQEYLLFEKSYDDIRGGLEYRDPKETTDGGAFALYMDFGDTLNDCELNDRGDFVRAFSTMDEAKQYAIEVNDMRHHVNRENVIRDIHDSRIEKIAKENRIREYDAMLLLGERYDEIFKVITEYEFPDEYSGGGGFVLSALEKQLGIDGKTVRELMRCDPMRILLPRYQRKAKELREKLGGAAVM